MKKDKYLLAIPMVVTLLLFLTANYFKIEMFWGLNHFIYLDSYFLYVLAGLTVVLLYLTLGRIPSGMIDRVFDRISALLWSNNRLGRLIVSGLFGVLFFIFKVQTAFLGDGYFLLNIFGRNEAYTSDLIKPLSILIIKSVQTLYGGFTYETALYAFQTLSIVSGVVVVYNLIVVSGLLSESTRGRILNLAMLIFSGWLLLFFGYIEYYPLLWMASTFLIRFSIEHVQKKCSLWLVLLLFFITIGIHAQAIYFLPGVVYLLGLRFFPNRIKEIRSKQFGVGLALMISLVIALVFIASNILVKGQNPFLPLTSIGLSFPNYGVLSLWNAIEVFNLLLLCIPAILILASQSIFLRTSKPDSLSRLLALFSFGSVTFLLTMNPILGLARDFDLMSLTLLCPLLFLLNRIGRKDHEVSIRFVLICIFISLASSVSFMSTNISGKASESRMFYLLKYYGKKEKGGWTSFAKYFEHKGATVLHSLVESELLRVFPEEQEFRTATSLLSSGKLPEAEELLKNLLTNDPTNGKYWSVLGTIRSRQGRFKEAIDLYVRALVTHKTHYNYYNLGKLYLQSRNYPSAVEVLLKADRISPMNEDVLTALCNAYFMSGNTSKAKVIADQILQKVNHNSPDAYAFYLVHSINQSDLISAKKYYELFIKYGADHSDYSAIRKAYKYLEEK